VCVLKIITFFMKKTYIFILVCLVFACTKKSIVVIPPIEPVEPSLPKSITYLALGDSYTIGESVDAKLRYPEQLSDSLRALKVEVNTLKVIAKTGWTTDELDNAINNTTDLKPSYDLVSLLIGVNNQYRGRTVESYKPEFTALLERAIKFAGGNKNHVFVVSIPDYAFTPFGSGSTKISLGIDEYNAANEEITKKMGVKHFNITPISREGLADKDLVAKDGLHPSGKQYTRWTSLFLQNIKTLLK
jgi:lysophospholipase L1-like esterase